MQNHVQQPTNGFGFPLLPPALQQQLAAQAAQQVRRATTAAQQACIDRLQLPGPSLLVYASTEKPINVFLQEFISLLHPLPLLRLTTCPWLLQEAQASLLSTLSGMIQSLAHKISDLSSLPGAAEIIGPDMATVVKGITSISPNSNSRAAAPAPAQMQPPAQHTKYPALSLNTNAKGLSVAGRLSSLDRQRPSTPPAQPKALPTQHVSPVTPSGYTMPAQPGCVAPPMRYTPGETVSRVQVLQTCAACVCEAVSYSRAHHLPAQIRSNSGS